MRLAERQFFALYPPVRGQVFVTLEVLSTVL